MTTITVERVDDTYHFRGQDEHGSTVDMDSVGDRDGPPRGVGPMSLLLFALGGCSGVDVAMILKKGRQEIRTFKMRIDGERPRDQVASPYSSVHVHYELTGELDPEKVLRAIRLSHEKFCSVVKTLETSATITYSCSVNSKAYE